MKSRNNKLNRAGGVYIAVLGASLVVGLLGASALVGQRIQNRTVTASSDIRQAQLNANSAIEMGLLVMKQESNWRSSRSNGPWFSSRDTGAGTCELEVIDPHDGNLSNNPDDPVVMTGIGYRGNAQQRVKLTVEPLPEALSSLHSAVAAGNAINLQGDTLRTDGLITANQVTATASQVYGDVEAVTVSGSTFTGTATQVDSAKLPTMPNWSTVFDYYRANGTNILYGALPSANAASFARNGSFEIDTANWSGTAPGLPGVTADITRSSSWSSVGTYSLRVSNRTSWQAGAVQRIEHFVKPGQQYTVSARVAAPSLVGRRDVSITLYTKGTGNASASFNTSPSAFMLCVVLCPFGPVTISGTVTAPPWSGDLEYAFIKVAEDPSGNRSTGDLYIDNVNITQVSSGRHIYRQVLSPTVNSLGGGTNPEGIYKIDCGGQRLTIERSRIVGTLLLINPGPNSGIADGPINWTPAVAGYPALLVEADDPSTLQFYIRATNRVLSEAEQLVNFNPAGAPHEQFGSDTNELNDIYPTVIRGLVAVEGDFAFQNQPRLLGQLLVGRSIMNSNGELDVEYQADSLLNPPPGFLAHIRIRADRAPCKRPFCRRGIRCQVSGVSCQSRCVCEIITCCH